MEELKICFNLNFLKKVVFDKRTDFLDIRSILKKPFLKILKIFLK